MRLCEGRADEGQGEGVGGEDRTTGASEHDGLQFSAGFSWAKPSGAGSETAFSIEGSHDFEHETLQET